MDGVVLLLGYICSGKTTLAHSKYKHHHYVKVSDIVKRLSGAQNRQQLQSTSALDKHIAEELYKEIQAHSLVVIDGIRQPSIIDFLLRKLHGKKEVDLVWVDTPLEECKRRFEVRQRQVDSDDTFEDAVQRDDALGLQFIPLLYKTELRYERTALC